MGMMKRLRPVALMAVSPDECRLRCRPRFDQIGKDEHSQLLNIMRQIAVGETRDDTQLESEFVFKFNEDDALLHDKYFFALTTDDYGDMWIDRAVMYLSLANEERVSLPDRIGSRVAPRTIFVDEDNPESARIYRVVFDGAELQTPKCQTCEYQFIVEGGPGNIRKISWAHGAYTVSWERKNWTFTSSPPPDLEPLLLAIIRLDEAINLELMPYAMS